MGEQGIGTGGGRPSPKSGNAVRRRRAIASGAAVDWPEAGGCQARVERARPVPAIGAVLEAVVKRGRQVVRDVVGQAGQAERDCGDAGYAEIDGGIDVSDTFWEHTIDTAIWPVVIIALPVEDYPW